MTPLLFHKSVYAPAPVFRSPGVVRVKYSRHALAAAADDRYGDLRSHLRQSVDVDTGEVIEVELCNGVIQKRVVRFRATPRIDLVMVIANDGLVKTVWGNDRDDAHTTLDTSKYVKAPKSIQ